MSQIYDTIIIGGGFAGLAAARELSGKQSVLLLEANDRLGGRAYSGELGGTLIEYGGGYVNWTHPHMWAEIMRYGLNVIERPHYSSTNAMVKTRFLIDGVLQEEFSPGQAAGIAAAFKAFVAPAKDLFPEPYAPFTNPQVWDYDKLSSEDRINQLDLNDLERASLTRTAGMQCNNHPSQGGYIEALRWYALANCDGDTYAASVSRFTLAEGTRALLQAMANDCDAEIKLGCPVTKVAQTPDGGVSVETAGETFIAKTCIVATGVNVWKYITFEPALSTQKQALTNQELSGKGGKIYVALQGKFKDSRWSAIGGPILSVLPHTIDDDRSVIVVFTNPSLPFDEITKASLQREINRFDDSYEVLDFTHHDWTKDPYALGTWGNFRPGQFTQYFQDALEPEGRLFFAGADIALGWRGFFDGALESGIRAARQCFLQAN